MVWFVYTESEVTMPKGRPTAEFTINQSVEDGLMTIVITADVNEGVDDIFINTSANGTVQLGREVAELAKVATPITNAERKFEENVAMLVASGLSETVARQAAAQLK